MATTRYTPEQIRNAVDLWTDWRDSLGPSGREAMDVLLGAATQHADHLTQQAEVIMQAPANAHTEHSQRLGAAAQRITNAIRRFTVDAPDGKPNGPVEEAINGLVDSLSLSSYKAFGPRAFNIANGWGAKLSEALAADTKELREAADAYFGCDFTKP